MECTKEENEQKLEELAEKYRGEDCWKKGLMAFAIGMSKIFDGNTELGDCKLMLQGPMGTWAEQVDKDMDRYEKLFNEKYK
tara:strand:- start:477 stop:719 length:243 start_codon:yes stop_codon:yes gene_type:complete